MACYFGPHIYGYNNLTLEFYKDEQYVTIHDDHPQLPSPAKFNQLKRMKNTHVIVEDFTLSNMMCLRNNDLNDLMRWNQN